MNNVLSVKFESVEQIKSIVKELSNQYGCVIRPRGRHSNRKSVLGNGWRRNTQNDIPWRMAENVSFYKISK